jgi:predicted RNase H-like nuclease (RuvC/YqgF family)
VEDSFKLLEDRVHRAAQRLKDLSAEADGLRAEIGQAKARAEKAERALAEAAGRHDRDAEGAKKTEALTAEVRTLRREREEIRDRVVKLVGLLGTLTDHS